MPAAPGRTPARPPALGSSLAQSGVPASTMRMSLTPFAFEVATAVSRVLQLNWPLTGSMVDQVVRVSQRRKAPTGIVGQLPTSAL